MDIIEKVEKKWGGERRGNEEGKTRGGKNKGKKGQNERREWSV